MVAKYRATHDHQGVRQRQPYEVVLEGILLLIDKDVFPSDVGYTTRNMGRVIAHYSPRIALDMGCGSGYLPLVMRRLQIPVVWAADIHPLAITCTRKNLARNSHPLPINVVQSDLFENIPRDLKYDLITFNQPFFPSSEDEFIAGTSDGGAAVIKRFLSEAATHLNPGGAIIMPFQDTAGVENDSAKCSSSRGPDCANGVSPARMGYRPVYLRDFIPIMTTSTKHASFGENLSHFLTAAFGGYHVPAHLAATLNLRGL